MLNTFFSPTEGTNVKLNIFSLQTYISLHLTGSQSSKMPSHTYISMIKWVVNTDIGHLLLTTILKFIDELPFVKNEGRPKAISLTCFLVWKRKC